MSFLIASRVIPGVRSASFFARPALKLRVVGVTGTDGRTTTAAFVRAILRAAGHGVGMVTSVGAAIGKERLDTGAHVTTPRPFDLHGYLARMVEHGDDDAVVETTSQGLVEGRVLYRLAGDLLLFSSEIKRLLRHPAVIRSFEDPPDTTGVGGLATYRLARAAGCSVVLDGQGADEQQTRYTYHRFAHLQRLPVARVLREGLRLRATMGASGVIDLALACRLAFSGRLPDAIVWRRDKVGWTRPERNWLDGPLAGWAESIVSSSAFLRGLKSEALGFPASVPYGLRRLNLAAWHDCFFGTGTATGGRSAAALSEATDPGLQVR